MGARWLAFVVNEVAAGGSCDTTTYLLLFADDTCPALSTSASSIFTGHFGMSNDMGSLLADDIGMMPGVE